MRDWRSITPLDPRGARNPFWFMTLEQFSIGIEQLVSEGLVLPHGIFPGSYPGGVAEAVCTSWARWRAYEWNPPEFVPVGPRLLKEYGDTDSGASPKPSWQDIRAAWERAALVRGRDRAAAMLREECRARITAAYGERSIEDEILLRLRAGHTAAQDAERDRLRARYRVLVAGLDDMALDALESFDPGEDRHWSPAAAGH